MCYDDMACSGAVVMTKMIRLSQIAGGALPLEPIDPENPTIFPVLAGSVNMKNAEIVTASPEIWQYYLAITFALIGLILIGRRWQIQRG